MTAPGSTGVAHGSPILLRDGATLQVRLLRYDVRIASEDCPAQMRGKCLHRSLRGVCRRSHSSKSLPIIISLVWQIAPLRIGGHVEFRYDTLQPIPIDNRVEDRTRCLGLESIGTMNYVVLNAPCMKPKKTQEATRKKQKRKRQPMQVLNLEPSFNLNGGASQGKKRTDSAPSKQGGYHVNLLQ